MDIQGVFQSIMMLDLIVPNMIIQSLVILAVILQVFGWMFKYKVKILIFHLFATLLYAIHFLLLSIFTDRDATASSVINIIGVVRLVVFISIVLYISNEIKKDLEVSSALKSNKTNKSFLLTFVEKYFFWLLVILYLGTAVWRILLIINARRYNMNDEVLGAIFAALASILYTTLFWKCSESVMRLGQIIVSILLITQAWFLRSLVGIGELGILLMVLWSIYRYDLNFEWKESNKNAKRQWEKAKLEFRGYKECNTNIKEKFDEFTELFKPHDSFDAEDT